MIMMSMSKSVKFDDFNEVPKSDQKVDQEKVRPELLLWESRSDPECPAGMRTGSWNCMRSMITRTHGIMSLCVRNFSDSESRVASVTK